MSISVITRIARASFRFLWLPALIPATAAAFLAGGALAASAERLSVSAQARPLAAAHPSMLSAALSAMPDQAKAVSSTAITLTFEGLQDQESVTNFYAGGLGSSGSGPGPNYGITFSGNALACIDDQHGGSCSYVGEPSLPTQMLFLSGAAATMNVPAGFTTGFSFYYAAAQSAIVVVYDGVNATGNVLATLTMPVTPPNSSTGSPSWAPFGVTFSGTARSVDFGGTENYVGFDNITINSSTPGAPLVLPPPKLMSKTVSGAPTTKNSTHTVFSGNGSVAVFESQETNLVTINQQMAGGQDVYRVVGTQTVLENKDSSGNQLIGTSSLPAVSGDGGVVAFVFASGAAQQAKAAVLSNIWAGSGGQPKHQIDKGTSGAAPNGPVSGAPSVASANGSNKLVFCSAASNLVTGDSNGQRDVFLVDPTNPAQATMLVSTNNQGMQLGGDSCEPSLSADGTKVAFTISAPALYGTSVRQVARKDLLTGKLEILSISTTGGFANADSSEPAINADGSVIAFTSQASNLDSLGAPVGGREAFVSLAQTGADGAARIIKRVRSGDLTVPNGASQHPKLSNDGTLVVMQTNATNFFGTAAKALGASGCGAVAITTNFFTPTALGSSLCMGQSSNQNPAISGDGSMAGFDSNAPQPSTSSSNSNTYSQGIGTSAIGVSNLSGDFSGQWYDPNQSGQGLVIDVIHPDANNNRVMILTWFVYVNGQPTWVQGVGIPQAGSGGQAGTVIVHMDQVAIYRGVSFPLGTARATPSLWGSITLAFTDANSGIMSWTSSYPGFSSGSMAITHFLPVGLPAQDAPGAQIKACYSGNWYNPAQSGHGFEFEVVPATPPVLVVDWFAFGPTGAPVWLQGSATINGNSAQVPLQLIDGPGAQFPPNFNPAQVTGHPWGTATFTFTDAAHASVTWNSTIAGYGSGTQPLQPTLGAGLLDRRTCQ